MWSHDGPQLQGPLNETIAVLEAIFGLQQTCTLVLFAVERRIDRIFCTNLVCNPNSFCKEAHRGLTETRWCVSGDEFWLNLGSHFASHLFYKTRKRFNWYFFLVLQLPKYSLFTDLDIVWAKSKAVEMMRVIRGQLLNDPHLHHWKSLRLPLNG